MPPSWTDRLATWLGRDRPRPPLNVVWICADDFAPYVSGAYGNPLARTPNLDRLAREGLRFDRAYCSCPLSTPSRMAFLTGRYPRTVGVTLSGHSLPADEATIGRLLCGAGYETVALGKTHFYRPLDGEFDRCVTHSMYRTREELDEIADRRPELRVLGDWRPFGDLARIWLNADGLPYSFDDRMSGTRLAVEAAHYLGQPHDRPFFLWVGFYEVHAPFRFPIDWPVRFDPASMPLHDVGSEDLDRIPEVFQTLTDADKRGISAAYYTSVSYMDRNVGLILDALDRSPDAGNTLVLFNSDHGYLLGQHGRFEKHTCFEDATRTALIARLPGLIPPGSATDALVELIDVVPTVLELCEVATPGNVQGRSFTPLLDGQAATHRNHVISEYADNAEAMVRTDRWKLIHSSGLRRRRDGYAGDAPPMCSTRLYDLIADPAELVDVADRPGNRPLVAQLLAVLADHLRATARDPGTIPADASVHALLNRCLTP